jgi:hypothetical protein
MCQQRFDLRNLGYSHDRQEVGNSVGVGGGKHEAGSKSPDLEIECSPEVVAQSELLDLDIVTIKLNLGNDEGRLLLGNEVP